MKKAILIIASTLVAQQALAADNTKSDSYAPSYSAGASIGTFGLGLGFSGKTPWHLKNGDQIQWRTMVSAIDGEGNFDDDVAGINYERVDYEAKAFQGGFDWYPVQSGWADEIFFSGGVVYSDIDAEMTADNSKAYTVGSTVVNPRDLDSLKTRITQDGVAPYISFGWGNKIETKPGFDFQAEIGMIFNGKPDVEITASGSNNNVTASDIKTEKDQIKNDLDGTAFASATVSYHF